MGLPLERVEGSMEVRWVREHFDKKVVSRAGSNEQRGGVSRMSGRMQTALQPKLSQGKDQNKATITDKDVMATDFATEELRLYVRQSALGTRKLARRKTLVVLARMPLKRVASSVCSTYVLHDNGCPFSDWACYHTSMGAARNSTGDLDCLKLIRDSGFEWKNGDYSQWLKPWSQHHQMHMSAPEKIKVANT